MFFIPSYFIFFHPFIFSFPSMLFPCFNFFLIPSNFLLSNFLVFLSLFFGYLLSSSSFSSSLSFFFGWNFLLFLYPSSHMFLPSNLLAFIPFFLSLLCICCPLKIFFPPFLQLSPFSFFFSLSSFILLFFTFIIYFSIFIIFSLEISNFVRSFIIFAFLHVFHNFLLYFFPSFCIFFSFNAFPFFSLQIFPNSFNLSSLQFSCLSIPIFWLPFLFFFFFLF